jgi:20S proteasome alpha/beta subunit
VLVDEESVSKISLITPQLGVAYSGMGPDSRVLVKQARKLSQAYYRLYKETIPVSQLVRETATVMQESTQQGCVTRPPARPSLRTRSKPFAPCDPRLPPAAAPLKDPFGRDEVLE